MDLEVYKKEIKINKKEISKLSLEFRTIASRLQMAPYDSGIDDLKRFLAFIDSNPILSDFVHGNQVKNYDIPSIVNSNHYDRYPIPQEKEYEISFTYQLLKYGAENFNELMRFTIQRGSAYGTTIKNSTQNFSKYVIHPFYQIVANHLQSILIDFGDEENKVISINVYGDYNYMEDSSINLQANDINNQGQILVGDNSGTVTQTISLLKDEKKPESKKLATILEDLKLAIETESAFSQSDKDEALEQVKLIAQAGKDPKDGKMKTIAKRATRILRGIREELPNATKFLEETNKFLPFIVGFFS